MARPNPLLSQRRSAPSLAPCSFYYRGSCPPTSRTAACSTAPSRRTIPACPKRWTAKYAKPNQPGLTPSSRRGPGEGTDTDANFGRLLDIAHKHGFSATIYFEVNSAVHHGDIAAQIQSVMSRYGSHPAFLRWNGKPVLFFWSPQTVGNSGAWAAIRARVDPGWGPGVVGGHDDASYLDAFDTIHFFSGGKWNGSTDVAKVNAQWRARVDDYNKRKAQAACGRRA